MKKMLALVLAIAISLCASAALADTLTMATNAAFAPYEFIGEEGNVVGIDAEIAALIVEKLGYELEIADMEFDSIIPAVQSGKADFAMAGLTYTEERAALIDFSTSYATGVQVVIVKNDSPITKVEDLTTEGNNYSIGTQISTTGDLYATWDIEEAGLGTVERFPNGSDAVMALVSGKIDCVMIDNEPAKVLVAMNDGLKILDTAYIEENYCAAFNKNNPDLTAKFNAALEELIADGTVKAVIEKYIPAE